MVLKFGNLLLSPDDSYRRITCQKDDSELVKKISLLIGFDTESSPSARKDTSHPVQIFLY